MNIVDSTDAELQAFDDVCQRLAGFDPQISAEWIDGYLCALAAGPRALTIDDWLPLVAGDSFERAFADPDDVAQARQALGARWRVLQAYLNPEALLDQPEALRLQPLANLWDDAARESLVTEHGLTTEEAGQMATGGVWAVGFFDALSAPDSAWERPDALDDDEAAVFDELLSQISVLLLADSDDDFKAHLQHYWKDRLPTREDLLDEACFAVQDLRVWWLDHAPKPATRRVEATPGRNDACPCGSGLKYKKCHGKSA